VNKKKARDFMDAVDDPMTVHRARGEDGELDVGISLSSADDLHAIVKAAEREGLVARFDGQRILIEEPPKPGLPVEVTPVETTTIEDPMNPEVTL
jgi:hypothetical protein